MYKQVFDPVSDSLALSSAFAALPLLALFLLLGGLRLKAQWAGLIALGVAILVAVIVYSMPVGQALDAAALGALFGFFPIMWIVLNAIWIYNMTVETGHFAVLRRAFGSVSSDQRIQAIIIAFCFGGLLEALAGFGTPVAITSVMLIALGFTPIKAATVALVSNTAPVAFGAIAVPIITLAEVTGLPKEDLGSMVGRQTPLLALLVPLLLVFIVDGRQGIRQTWPAAVVGGLAFAVGQFLCSNFISVELTDIVASLLGAGAIVLLLRVWSPGDPLLVEGAGSGPHPAMAGGAPEAGAGFEAAARRRNDTHADTRREILEACAPYLIIIAVFSLAQLGFVKDALARGVKEFAWPGLHIADPGGEAVATMFKFNWLPAAGTLLLISGLLTMAVLRVGVGRALRTYAASFDQLKWAILTVMAVLALAFVMNLSGQTSHHRALARGGRRPVRPPLAHHRVARRRRDRVGHVVELAVRRAADRRRQGRGALADAPGSGQLLGRRPRKDDLAAEPRDRGGRRRHGGQGGRALPKGLRLQRGDARGHVRAGVPAVDGAALVDGPLRSRTGSTNSVTFATGSRSSREGRYGVEGQGSRVARAALSFAQVPGAMAGAWLGQRVADRRTVLTGAAVLLAVGSVGVTAIPGGGHGWAALAGLGMGILFTIMLT